MVVFFVTAVAAKAQTVSGQICDCRVSPCLRTQHRVSLKCRHWRWHMMMTQARTEAGAWWVPNTAPQWSRGTVPMLKWSIISSNGTDQNILVVLPRLVILKTSPRDSWCATPRAAARRTTATVQIWLWKSRAFHFQTRTWRSSWTLIRLRGWRISNPLCNGGWVKGAWTTGWKPPSGYPNRIGHSTALSGQPRTTCPQNTWRRRTCRSSFPGTPGAHPTRKVTAASWSDPPRIKWP